MSTMNEPVSRPGLLARVKGILLQPAREWDAIDREPATIGGLYAGYVAPLAAIPAICGLIGMLVFGLGMFGVTIKPPVGGAVVSAVVSYLLTLAGVFVLALIIEFLAPNFGGQKDRVQAFKVAAYSGTAGWVAGVLTLLPALSIIAALLGLYGLYLLYLGLPKLMKTPQDKALPYTAVVIIAAIVVFLVIGLVTAPLRMIGAGSLGVAGAGAAGGEVSVPGVGSVNLGELEAAAERMERAAENPQPATPAATLQALLPATIAGMPRESTSSGSGGMAGINASNAEAVYAAGDARIELSVSDVGAMGGLASLGGALNVESSEDDGTRYEKIGRVDGRMTTEEYDRSARSGKYGFLVGDRFMVEAEGQNVSIDQLKAATRAVNVGQLERMAR